MATITPKQKLFALEYLVDHNATQAAIRAGYSPKTAEVQGSRLLRNAQVKEFVAEKEVATEKRLEISAERTKMEIARIAFQDVRQFFDKEGKLIPIHLLSDDAAAALAGMDIEEIWGYDVKADASVQQGELKKIRRYDKMRALDMLCKHFKIYQDTPPPPININLNNLSPAELKALLAIKKKLHE